ncbi:MAG: hypothetical protein CSB55_01070 [Candidatus Cloacimonadota bacterium]|nr:MAG: hypothetical protein CSB55_01070 [Candidatus Cloacimonadota bacterium]
MKKIISLIASLLFIQTIFPENNRFTEDYLEAVFARAATIIIEYKDVQKQAFEEYVGFGADGVPYLISQLTTNSAPELHAIRKIIKEIGEPAVPVLTAALNDTSLAVVSQSAYMLGESSSPEAVAPLRKLLRHKKSSVRMNAIRGLAKTGDINLLNDFLTASEDSSMSVRKQVAGSLFHFPYREVKNILVKCYRDKDFEVRQAADASLSKMFSEAEEEIIKDIDLYNNYGKREIIRLTGTTEDKKYKEVIIPYLDSSDDVLHIQAHTALQKICPATFEEMRSEKSCRFPDIF